MICRVCTEDKPTEAFYARLSRCKECHKAAMKTIRLTNPAVQAYDRLRSKTPDRKAKARAVTIKWRADHPAAYHAHSAVNYAIRAGKLKKQPCELCGTEDHVHAHHRDYSRPLDVKWLCAKCHHRIHSIFPELGGHAEAAE